VLRTSKRKGQETESKALVISSFNSTLGGREERIFMTTSCWSKEQQGNFINSRYRECCFFLENTGELCFIILRRLK
jgi:hypothetical protein